MDRENALSDRGPNGDGASDARGSGREVKHAPASGEAGGDGGEGGEVMGATRDGAAAPGAEDAGASDTAGELARARAEVRALHVQRAAREALYAAGALDVGASEASLRRAMSEHPDFVGATTPESLNTLATSAAATLRERRPGLFAEGRGAGEVHRTPRAAGVMGIAAAPLAGGLDPVVRERAGAGERGSLLMFLRGRRR